MVREPNDSPLISVVIPVRNAPHYLRQCVGHLASSTYDNMEIIVVDDASTDDTADVAEAIGTRVVRLESQTGPAGARNQGAAAARGDIVFFVDADVCVHTDTVEKVINTFVNHPDVDAVFGSYDLKPYVGNVISQYKNLYHHFVHQQAAEEASTFWSGCGAMRRSVFLEMGGFDTSYGRPCIEDIELGVRLHQANRRIMLNKSIQVTHLKRWTLWGVIKTDFWDRGVPWTELMLRSGSMPNDLNLKTSQRVCALLTAAVFLMLIAGIWTTYVLAALPIAGILALQLLDRWTLHRRVPMIIRLLGVCTAVGVTIALIAHFRIWAVVALSLILVIILLNHKLYAFFAREKRPLFAALVVPLHLCYYLYSSASLATGIVFHFWKTRLVPRFAFGKPSPNRNSSSVEPDGPCQVSNVRPDAAKLSGEPRS